METAAVAPDERALRADLGRPEFRLGEAQERWSKRSISWPIVLIGVTASDSAEFVLRFNCAGYPQVGPTAGLWDPVQDTILPFDKFPLHNGGRVSQVFRTDWEGGRALYHPCDRHAISTHGDWPVLHPSKLWRPEKGIVQYLEFVHELLNCSDYKTRLCA